MAELPELRPASARFADDLQQRLSCLVGDAVALEVVTAGAAAPDGLDASPFIRHRQYRDGRRALGRVLRRLQLPDDPITISMPHPRLSLTHTGDIAIAVGLQCQQAAGVGIDVEHRRPFDIRSARFFLDEDELRRWPDWAERRGADPDAQELTLQQLWTVKEAVFKAHLVNAGRQLREYHIDSYQRLSGIHPGDPWVGQAHCGPAVLGFRSVVVDNYIFTIALRERTTS